jgi:hypothetical protein
MLLFLFTHLSKPRVLILALEMHLLVAIARQICILAFALEPPSGMIILTDFFLENTFYPTDTPLTKDLFFSGHVATIWIYVLCSQIEYLKMYLFFATLAMTFMVLCMRIHYTYDVYGAIVITSSIYFLQLAIRRYKAVTKSYTSVPISNTNASK